jgi:hypothetical protein
MSRKVHGKMGVALAQPSHRLLPVFDVTEKTVKVEYHGVLRIFLIAITKYR